MDQGDNHPSFLLADSGQNGDLLQLLALVVGDGALDALTEGVEEVVHEGRVIPVVQSNRTDVVRALIDHYHDPLITELLLRTAVKNRIRLDAWHRQQPTMLDGKKLPNFLSQMRVGDLTEGAHESRPMTLREGCNKIIHADRILFPRSKDGRLGPCLDGIVETEGTNKGEPWRASLSVVKYARASIYNAYGAFEFARGAMRPR